MCRSVELRVVAGTYVIRKSNISRSMNHSPVWIAVNKMFAMNIRYLVIPKQAVVDIMLV